MISSNILSIVIFGSTARCESDTYSDVDVCVIVQEPLDVAELEPIKKQIQVAFSLSNPDINIYSVDQIEIMNKYGSLFLWHLKLEGKVLYDDGFFKSTIDHLCAYDKHLSELNFHASLLKDVESSMQKFGVVNELDLSQLFTICRNTCMIFSHFYDSVAFGRKSAYTAAKRASKTFPLDEDVYNYLSKWKLRYERGMFDEMKLPDKSYTKWLIAQCKELIYFCAAEVAP